MVYSKLKKKTKTSFTYTSIQGGDSFSDSNKKPSSFNVKVRAIAVLTAILNLIFITIMYNYAHTDHLFYGISDSIVFSLTLPCITTALSILILILVVFGKVSGRFRGVPATQTIPLIIFDICSITFIAFLANWNLFGFNY